MKFALLGDDPAAARLLDAIASSPEHALTCVTLAAEPMVADVLRIAPAARHVPQWEELLADAAIDAVIVAGHEAGVLEAARRLASAGKPLLVLPDVRQGLAFIYELTLIRDDTGVVLCPAFPDRFDSAVLRLKAIIDSGRLGELLHLQLERRNSASSPSAGKGAPSPISQAEIDEALFHDVDLLRFLGGDYNQVTALWTGPGEGVVSLASVALAGEGLPPVSWSLKVAPRSPSEAWSTPPWKLLAIGQKHTVALSREEEGPRFRLDADDTELADVEIPTLAENHGESLLARFVSLTADGPSHSDWSDLTQAFELVDAARRSVFRRRTIDVHFLAASERSVFKTQMTAIGCGLLVATFLAVLLVLLIGELFEPSAAVMRVLRLLVFAPLLVFLALQLLVLIARPSSAERTPPEGWSGGPAESGHPADDD